MEYHEAANKNKEAAFVLTQNDLPKQSVKKRKMRNSNYSTLLFCTGVGRPHISIFACLYVHGVSLEGKKKISLVKN